MARLMFLCICLFCMQKMAGGNKDVLLTRDGIFTEAQVVRISGKELTFIAKKDRKRHKTVPVDFVYMVIREKGTNIFFDEEGNQTSLPVAKCDAKDDVVFLNDGRYFPVYDLSVGKDELVYRLRDKKKEPFYKSYKGDVFLIRYSNGTVSLMNNSYLEKQRKANAIATQETSDRVGATAKAVAPAYHQTRKPQVGQKQVKEVVKTSVPLLASAGGDYVFSPAKNLSAQEIEMKVNQSDPYTLYRKGSIAEYAFERNNKSTKLNIGWGVSFVQQVVADAKIQDGLLVAYVQQRFLNSKHEYAKGLPATFKSYYFPTEIDTAGTFHLTHDITRDLNSILVRRQGYAMLMPSVLNVNDALKCATITDDTKNGAFGTNKKVTKSYSGFTVVAEETIAVPAGTFKCVKLVGNVTVREGDLIYTCKEEWWLARGIGIVKYAMYIGDSAQEDAPSYIMHLNKVDIK